MNSVAEGSDEKMQNLNRGKKKRAGKGKKYKGKTLLRRKFVKLKPTGLGP